MLKLNKAVHFNILTIFAIVFVCVYLYYTIADIKKIAIEVKKHSQDITNIITSLGTITKELGELKKKCLSCPVTGSCKVASSSANVVVTPQPQITISAAQPSSAVVEGSVSGKVSSKVQEYLIPEDLSDEDSDDDSVATADVQKLLSDPLLDDDIDEVIDNVSNEISNVTEEVLPSSVVLDYKLDYKKLSIDELKAMKSEDLKEYCRVNGLNTKGTKDAMIARIKA